MGDKEQEQEDYYAPGTAAFNYNNVTGGADSASGGSGGSGMECMQVRSQPFHYLISEQAKSLVALQELQNEVGALLEFRDLVIETFPNLRSKMSPSPAPRRDWEPGVRVRRKLPTAAGEPRTKPQPSVQDSGFSTETSCGKDASASRSRPLEDELLALLDVIQRKGVRLRDEAELLRGELDERPQDTAEESFARALSGCGDCADLRRLRSERDALLAKTAQLEADAFISPPATTQTPLGRLDSALETPVRLPRLSKLDPKKVAAILLESNPIELQRQLLVSTAQNQLLRDRLKRLVSQRSSFNEKLERAKDVSEDLKFRLEEKCAELESTRARLQSPGPGDEARRASMRELQPLQPLQALQSPPPPSPPPPPPPGEARRRPSRIPLHTAHKPAPRRRPPPPDNKNSRLAEEYVSRAGRLAPLCAGYQPLYPAQVGPPAQVVPPAQVGPPAQVRPPRVRPLPADLAYCSPQNLALELSRSIVYEHSTDLWSGKPQQYFDSMRYGHDDSFDDN